MKGVKVRFPVSRKLLSVFNFNLMVWLVSAPLTNLAQSNPSPVEEFPNSQSEQPDTELPAFASEEEEIDITVTGEILDQPVYAPFRQEGTVRDSSRPVYVIDRQQIEAQGARTVQEALKYVPGIIGDGTAGGQLGALSSQFIRGGNSAQVLILLDGRPMNDVGFFGGFDLSEFTTDNVERIELLPGGGSTLYGSDALGGVINIITRAPADEKPEVTLRAAVGSFGLNEQGIQARGRSGDFGWSVGYNRTQAENDFPFKIDRIGLQAKRDNADVLYNNLNLKLEGQLGDRNKLTFSALYIYAFANYTLNEPEIIQDSDPSIEGNELRAIYVLGTRSIPYAANPLKRPYLSVCRSSRCHPCQEWEPIIEALQTAVKQASLDVYVMTSGCLEVCKAGPVVFYSGDNTWYTRVTPEVAQRIVQEHVVQGHPVQDHLYPPIKQLETAQ